MNSKTKRENKIKKLKNPPQLNLRSEKVIRGKTSCFLLCLNTFLRITLKLLAFSSGGSYVHVYLISQVPSHGKWLVRKPKRKLPRESRFVPS